VNAVCDRVIETLRRECLERTLILGRRHLETVLAEYVEYYNWHRSHRSLNQRSPAASETTPPVLGEVHPAQLRSTDHLGGLIHGYRWRHELDGWVLGTHKLLALRRWEHPPVSVGRTSATMPPHPRQASGPTRRRTSA